MNFIQIKWKYFSAFILRLWFGFFGHIVLPFGIVRFFFHINAALMTEYGRYFSDSKTSNFVNRGKDHPFGEEEIVRFYIKKNYVYTYNKT